MQKTPSANKVYFHSPEDFRKDKHKGKTVKRILSVYLAVTLILAAFIGGVLAGKGKAWPGAASGGYGQIQGKNQPIPEYLSKNINFKIFWDAWQTIENNYLKRPVAETQLFYGALDGLVAGLNDPYSTFFEPQSAADFSEELQGRFEGIGAEIAIKNGVLTVVSPLADSPAERAGLRAGDLITRIDGVSSAGMNIVEAVDKIRGEKGSQVVLSILRPKSGATMDIEIKRDTIKVVSVVLKNLNKEEYPALGSKRVALLEVTNFNSDTAARFAEAARQIVLNRPDAVILDLRGNPGGYLTTAVDLASYWLDQGQLVVKEVSNGGKTEEHLTAGYDGLEGFQTVVLINGGSASGSEILAGALDDYAQAVLIGETTFGKGSVQRVFDLADGSAIKLTIAEWLTPQGRQINLQGIAPEIVVELTEEDYNNNRDPQLDRAIEFIINGE